MANTMTPDTVRYRHLNNVSEHKKILQMMGDRLFGDDFKGFIKEYTYLHTNNCITKKIVPIANTPTQEFRKHAEEAGLIGKKFDIGVEDG